MEPAQNCERSLRSIPSLRARTSFSNDKFEILVFMSYYNLHSTNTKVLIYRLQFLMKWWPIRHSSLYVVWSILHQVLTTTTQKQLPICRDDQYSDQRLILTFDAWKSIDTFAYSHSNIFKSHWLNFNFFSRNSPIMY